MFLNKMKIGIDMIYLLTAIGLTPGGSTTVHIYTQTIHRTTQLTKLFPLLGFESRTVEPVA